MENKMEVHTVKTALFSSNSSVASKSSAVKASRTRSTATNESGHSQGGPIELTLSTTFGREPPSAVALTRGTRPFEGGMTPYEAHGEDDDELASVGSDQEELHENTVFPVADEHGHPVHYPHEEKAGDGYEPPQKTEQSHSVIGSAIESLKYFCSSALVIFSVSVVMASIFSKQTKGTADMKIPTWVACIVFWFLICWLAMMEGGQGALVGLQPIDKTLYASSHPRSLKNTKVAHKGDNMERFIVGRQFLVVLVVFVINMMGSAVSDASVLGLSDVLNQIFLSSGVALILVTIVLGQLSAQVNASNCMLDFINNYFMLFTTYVSLAIEASGLLHSVYVFNYILGAVAGKQKSSSEAPRGIMFWVRVVLSLVLLGFAFAVTIAALFDGKTAMWTGVPHTVSLVLLFFFICFVGVLEGIQIALFAVVNMPEETMHKFKRAHRNCRLTFSGQNLQAFLIGRQICVTVSMFLVARITTIDTSTADTVLGVSPGLQEFFNTGLLGALITTVTASLAWRVAASTYPLSFLGNPVIYPIIRLCLVVEKSGLCSAAWVLARYQKIGASYHPDEVYLQDAEPHTAEPITRRDKDIDRVVTVCKFLLSLALLVFSVLIVLAAVCSKQTVGTSDMGVPIVVALFIFLFLICWLAMMEGGQGALVGLQPIDKTLYTYSHPRSLLSTRVAHKGDNMERFIVGRQFLVVLVVFGINMMGSAVSDASVLGLPEPVNQIFLASGIALILVTIVFGQLTAQVNAASCMLDFINNYFMVFTTYVSLAIEASGLLHSVYLVQIVFSKISGKEIQFKESRRNCLQYVLFWARVVASLGFLGFALAVVVSALFNGQTKMWNGVPNVVSFVVFLALMVFVGLMEGMQIALFAVVNMPERELRKHKTAHRTCELTFRDQNLQAFLIGRQICVTGCMFVVARITSMNAESFVDGETVFDVSRGMQEFFNTGLLGALVTTIIGSLVWRVIASSYPLAFLSNPMVYFIVRLCLVLEASGLCSVAWVFGRLNKLWVGYQPDEVHLQGVERHTKAPVNRRDKNIDVTLTVLKYGYSLGLFLFSVSVVMAAIFSSQTKVAEATKPVAAFAVIWVMLLWLAVMEGGQGCLVGLQPVDKALYAESHPISLRNTRIAHKGDNMERFIVGRQLLVVIVVFVCNMCGSAVADAQVLGLSETATEVFLAAGVAMILMTIIIGQLTAQVNAANCMLDFINNYFMTFTIYVSLAIEASGLLHVVYLVQIIFASITGKPIESNEPTRTDIQDMFFWARVFMSLGVLGFSFAVTLSALFNGQTTMYEGVPEAVSVVLLFVLMCFVGLMEGMQIALFAVVNLPDEQLRHSPLAAKTCELTFKDNNLQAFLIGRQICVTCCMFLVARITSCDVGPEDETIFGVSSGIQQFFNTGLLGAIITTIVASLAWRIIASSFPVAFLSNPLVYVIIRLCLAVEASGICSAAWLLALSHKQIAGYQLDEVYIGTPETRPDNSKVFDLERQSSTEWERHDAFSDSADSVTSSSAVNPGGADEESIEWSISSMNGIA